MWSFLRGEPDSIVDWSPHILIAGMALFALSHFLNAPGGVVGFSMISLGAAGASLERWRTERGLWMLAAVFLGMFSLLYFGFCYGHMRDFWNGAPRMNLALAVEVTLSTLLLVTLLRFLARVAAENYVVSISRNDEIKK